MCGSNTCTDKQVRTKAVKVKIGRSSYHVRHIGDIVCGAAEFSSKSKVVGGAAGSKVEYVQQWLIFKCNLIQSDNDEYRDLWMLSYKYTLMKSLQVGKYINSRNLNLGQK